MTEINQQRIAKNTLLLYIRMIIVMLVGLYTSRVIINALGQEHYGIYEAVGSIVLMVSFISSTMSGACQRYYSYEMTKGSIEELRKVLPALQLFGTIDQSMVPENALVREFIGKKTINWDDLY